MIFRLPVTPVVERLRTQVSALRRVEGVAEIESAMTATSGKSPSAYVAVVAEQGGPRRGASGCFIQSVDAVVAVVLCLRNYSASAAGAAATVDLDQVLIPMRQALLNWRHPNAELVFEFGRGNLIDYVAGTVWWQDTFLTRYTTTVNS